MKKKYLIILFIVGLVGLFLPKGVFASEYSLRYIPAIDYRFFLEDEDEHDIEDKKFKLHDVNNLISYESEYDSNTKAYYFIDFPTNTYGNPNDFKNIEKGILPEYLNNELKNTDFNSFSNYKAWDDFITNLSQKYKGLDPGLQFYIPMILEEVNHTGDGEPIKKVVFAIGLLFPGDIDENGNIIFGMQFMLINNTCMYKDNMNGAPDEYIESVIRLLSLTRNETFDYSDEIINKYSLGNIASNEIEGNEYLNKGFLNDKFSTGEIASSEVSFNGKEISAVKLRNSSDNLKEEFLKDYCDCLPVFVQARKAPSIVEVITNPKTFTTGVMVLAVSLLLALGFVAFILTNQKKSDNEA